MKKISFIGFIFLFVFSAINGQQHKTPYELSGNKATTTYEECREWYRNLHQQFPDITFFDSIGTSDGGFPMYTFRIYTGENVQALRVLVMNNIHPGEPEGTDASMILVRNLLENPKKYREILQNIDLNILCQYNADGTKNRGCCRRANQDGPDFKGNRANAKNLDLNRDFIKMDSRNAKYFSRYFIKNKFQVFIDNHTSNGADYQYTLTYFHTRPEKLNPLLVPFMEEMTTGIEKKLHKRKIPTAPYVETISHVPDSGIVAFWETGRYSTGYASLHHCIGFTVETHMLKPFSDRVNVTLAFMEELLDVIADKKQIEKIQHTYREIYGEDKLRTTLMVPNRWVLDKSRHDEIPFLGYEFGYKTSAISGSKRLYYDKNKPWERNIPYYHYYKPADSVLVPRAYIVPQQWGEIIDRLLWNGIKMKQIPRDTNLMLRASYIQSYETVKNPYESHYMHYNTTSWDTLMGVDLHAGDYLIQVTNTNRSFLVAVLEARSPDSYFNWNFFDGILQQKEGFSDYVFEEQAMEILNKNPELKLRFEEKQKSDSTFASSPWAQLNWIYLHSEFFEPVYNRVPVYRMD
ncbi:MAG: hypothetical protein KG003_12385 [Bacteroidetes bacterium]|nr:hypothetical protein [Bacteroidota bacterium]